MCKTKNVKRKRAPGQVLWSLQIQLALQAAAANIDLIVKRLLNLVNTWVGWSFKSFLYLPSISREPQHLHIFAWLKLSCIKKSIIWIWSSFFLLPLVERETTMTTMSMMFHKELKYSHLWYEVGEKSVEMLYYWSFLTQCEQSQGFPQWCSRIWNRRRQSQCQGRDGPRNWRNAKAVKIDQHQQWLLWFTWHLHRPEICPDHKSPCWRDLEGNLKKYCLKLSYLKAILTMWLW